MAQPPLSQQIRDLETELAVSLFDRSKRPLQLTAAGEAFLPAVRQVLTQVDQAVQVAQRANRGETGRLVVGFNGSAAQSVLPGILQTFRDRFPHVDLILRELDSHNQHQHLHRGQIDCGFLHAQDPADPALQYVSVLQEPLVIALSQTHPLSEYPHIPLQSLAEESLILPPSHMGQGFYGQVMTLCQQAGFTPKAIQEARWIQTVLSLVAGGMGVALAPASMQMLQHPRVIYRALTDTTFHIEMGLAWRRDNPSPVLHEFVNVVLQTQKSRH